jgi:hypothetical protein
MLRKTGGGRELVFLKKKCSELENSEGELAQILGRDGKYYGIKIANVMVANLRGWGNLGNGAKFPALHCNACFNR